MFKTNKKGQSEIITTVLIILLVLAAIIIVWQVVSSTIEEGEQNIEQTSQCIGIDITMISAKIPRTTPTAAGTDVGTNGNITLRRDSGEPEGKAVDVIILVNGARINSQGASLLRFDSRAVLLNDPSDPILKVGDEVSVAYTVDGEACPNEPDVVGEVTA